jgi:hypothetical protein
MLFSGLLSIYVAFWGTNLELVIPVCGVCDVTQIVPEAEVFSICHLLIKEQY